MTFSDAFHVIGPREACAYLWDRIRPVHPEQMRTVIFGQGRTGSSVLENLISSTGHFRGFGELLNVERVGQINYPFRYVQGVSKWYAHTNFICHVKIYQLTRNRKKPVDPGKFLQKLSDNCWKIIYIRRENVIKQVLSGLVAMRRGAYHKLDDRSEEWKLNVDCGDFVERVSRRLRFTEQEELALEGIEHEVVVYERDLEDSSVHQQTIDRILGKHSLEKRPVSTAYRKINTLAMPELIANFSDFEACMKGHGWEAFLEYPQPDFSA
ncbi:hypothetical protein ACFL1S_02510 [Pseudomonadota bacterium]